MFARKGVGPRATASHGESSAAEGDELSSAGSPAGFWAKERAKLKAVFDTREQRIIEEANQSSGKTKPTDYAPWELEIASAYRSKKPSQQPSHGNSTLNSDSSLSSARKTGATKLSSKIPIGGRAVFSATVRDMVSNNQAT